MAAEYELRIYSPAGLRLASVVGRSGADDDPTSAGFLGLSYTKGVNEVGTGAFLINAESGVLSALELDGEPILDTQVEIWRRDPDEGITAYCDFYGFLRDRFYDTDERGVTIYTALLEEQNDLLRRAAILYRANTANRSLFSNVPTETILKTLVTRNATSGGTTADGRDRNVDAWGAFVSVEADGAAGTSQTLSCMGLNLFDVLQSVGNAGGIDFSLNKTGARAWEFRTAALLGTDRSSGGSTVTFSLLHGNMRQPSLHSNYRGERTVVTAGGQGTDAARTVRTRTGANYDATVNSYELFHNASQYTTTAGLDSAADERLEELRARDELSFDVIQVPSTLYGKHYFLGDKISAYYLGKSYTPQIRRVSIGVTAGGKTPETIEVTVADA
jgi:hypothetical protein